MLVISAGNAGPSGATGGSPGTGLRALTVGASSSAVHERILRDLQFGPGIGALYRPFGGVQTAYFSSRGPTADGRIDPDVVANGFASFGQGFGTAPGGLDIASGTSFASPSVAGVAAVLRQAVPTATARQVRNALMLSRQPALIADGPARTIGAGDTSMPEPPCRCCKTGLVPDIGGLPGLGSPSVELNILFTGIVAEPRQRDPPATNLKPGQRFEIFYVVPKDTSPVTITVSDVVARRHPECAVRRRHPADRAQREDERHRRRGLRGLRLHHRRHLHLPEQGFPFLPDTGLMRVTLNGDWTNASPISATVSITPGEDADARTVGARTRSRKARPTRTQFAVPAGTKRLDAQLEWDEDWGSIPPTIWICS